MMRCRRTPGADQSLVAIACSRNRTGELRWTLAGATLRLDGTLDGARVSMDARRLDDKDYPLMRGGVHVIYDRR